MRRTRTRSGANCTRSLPRYGRPGPCKDDACTLRLNQTVFPQMTNWLPEDEAAQLRLEFGTVLELLNA